MLFPYTFISLHQPANGPHYAAVTGFHDDDARLLFDAWNKAEAVHGENSQAVRAAWGRYLGPYCVAVHVAWSRVDAERIALDTTVHDKVRAAADVLGL